MKSTHIHVQLGKLKECMKEMMDQVQQVEKMIENVRTSKSKVRCRVHCTHLTWLR